MLGYTILQVGGIGGGWGKKLQKKLQLHIGGGEGVSEFQNLQKINFRISILHNYTKFNLLKSLNIAV